MTSTRISVYWPNGWVPDVPKAVTFPELQWLGGAQESCDPAQGSSSSGPSPPIISYSGNYRFEGNDLAAKVHLAWEDRWPRTEELHHYRLDGDKRLIETTHVRYPNAFGSKMVSILVWERE